MSWKTWSPFQSDDVKQICSHMTSSEISIATKHGFRYGCWVGFTLVFPISQIFLYLVSDNLIVVPIPILLILIVIHFIYIPISLKKQKEFLCSTEWAKANGYNSDQLKLFRFHTLFVKQEGVK